MILRIQPDIQRAKALNKMANITLERLSKLETVKYPSNALTDYYDIIHKLLEAASLISGHKTRGDGAHQELIELIHKQKIITDKEREFIQQMREYRNRISYEGFMIHQNYILLNEKFIIKIIEKLSLNIKKKII